MNDIIFQNGGWKVTNKVLETPKAAHDLEAIQTISARRTLLPMIGAPAIGLLLFMLFFIKYLYFVEILMILTLSAGLIVLALRFGSIRVNSIAHSNDSELATAYGDFELLKQVRAAALHVKSGISEPFSYDPDSVHDPLKNIANFAIPSNEVIALTATKLVKSEAAQSVKETIRKKVESDSQNIENYGVSQKEPTNDQPTLVLPTNDKKSGVWGSIFKIWFLTIIFMSVSISLIEFVGSSFFSLDGIIYSALFIILLAIIFSFVKIQKLIENRTHLGNLGRFLIVVSTLYPTFFLFAAILAVFK